MTWPLFSAYRQVINFPAAQIMLMRTGADPKILAYSECCHAVLLVTPNFLENTSWTRVEMSTLLTREVTEKNLIIPVWSGVDNKAVAARSARLADLFAIREFADADQLATQIFSVVSENRKSSAQQ
jgi:hypothetical protein